MIGPDTLIARSFLPVSYTHLDVYKRQALFLWAATQAAVRDGGSATAPLLGALVGLFIAVVLGYLCLLYTSRCV